MIIVGLLLVGSAIALEIKPISDQSVEIGDQVSFTVSTTGTDASIIEYGVSGLPSGASFDDTTGDFSWLPESSGNYQLQFSAYDGNSTATEDVIISVASPVITPVNTAPVIATIDPKTVEAGSTLSFTVKATDAESDELTYGINNKPNGADFDATSHKFTWTPTAAQAGEYTVEFTVKDEAGDSDTESVTITVTSPSPVNSAPVIDTIGPKTVEAGSTLSFTVTASDADGDALTYGINNKPDGANFDTSTHKFTWTPTAAQAGEYTVEFTVRDEYGGSDAESVAFTVTSPSPVNSAPVIATIGPKTVEAGSTLSFTVKATDADGDALTYDYSGKLPKGAKFDSSTHQFTWTPTAAQAGEYTVKFTVKDEAGDSDTESVTITVTSPSPVNSAPVITTIGPKTVEAGSTLSFTVTASDADGDALTYGINNKPDGANFDTSTHKFTWTPTAAQAGEYTVKFTVQDEYGSIDTESVAITVKAITVTGISVKAAPTKTVYTEGEALDLSGLVVTLTRVDGSTTDVPIVGFAGSGITVSPRNGAVLGTGDTQAVITHAKSGKYAVQPLTVNPVVVSVAGITVTGSSNATRVEKGKTLQMIASVLPSDASNKNVTWSVSGINGTATISQSGRLTGIEAGIVTVKATALDGSGKAGTVDITVTQPQYKATDSSSSGGGGSQTTGEKYENIEVKDYSIKYVLKATETLYEFSIKGNSIMSLGFTARLNGGLTKTTIEQLKDTSTLVNKDAPGTVYKNVNIWVGDGKTTPALLYDASIMFMVEKSWMAENGIDPQSIVMCRYNRGSWTPLPTSSKGEDDAYVYYLAKTPGFSSFAITSMNEEEMQLALAGTQEGSSTFGEDDVVQMSTGEGQASDIDGATSQEAQSAGPYTVLLILAVICALGILSYRYKGYLSGLHQYIGNPDGKRYRRIKKI